MTPTNPQIGPATGSPPTLEWVSIADLNIDHEYQRLATNKTSRALIGRMLREWKWRLCGPLNVSRRDDRSLWVLDGQHRLTGARERGDIQHLPCVIITGIGQGEEAQTFIDLNTQRQKLSENDKFLGLLAAGDAYAAQLAAILRETGWQITRDNNASRWKPGDLQCAPALAQLLRQRGPEAIRFALATARAAYIDEPLRQSSSILRALVDLFPITVEHNITAEKVATALGSAKPLGWIARAENYRAEHGVSAAVGLRQAILYAAAPQLRPAPREARLTKAPVAPPQSRSFQTPPKFNAEGKAWCDQCDRMVTRGVVHNCKDRHCKLHAAV